MPRVVAALILIVLPAPAWAAGGAGLVVSPWSVLPFGALLLSIAVLPLAVPRWWHSNVNRALVAGLCALPVMVYLLALHPATNGASTVALGHGLEEYFSFIMLLAALYVIASGIALKGDLPVNPLVNAAFLAIGALLANFIGTTGASMVLIRPYLRINRPRKNRVHLPVFFIFLVSNLGGLLTPMGDPPLLLGFLRGVPFLFKVTMWREWLLANGTVLAVFVVWDRWALGREPKPEAIRPTTAEPFRVEGLGHLFFLAGVVAVLLLRSPTVAGLAGRALRWLIPAMPDPLVPVFYGEAAMVVLASLSMSWAPPERRVANAFRWGPIIEVAVLFAGLFVCMVPALELLRLHGARFGLTEPWQFFWVTGLLSSVLDNAPTYVSMGTLAAGPHDFAWLAENRAEVLRAISCGAVFMGANTYLGNAPNFMVQAIAEDEGYPVPSFFGYTLYSAAILLPVFGLVTLLFVWH